MSQTKKIILSGLLILLAALLLEFFLSNDIGSLRHPAPHTPLDLSGAVCGDGVVLTDHALEFSQNSSVEWKLPEPVESQNLLLRFKSESQSYLSGEISIKDESRVNDYQILNTFSCNPGGKYHDVEIPLHSSGRLLSLQIKITGGVSSPVFLQQADLNCRRLHFQPVRWVVLVLLIGLIFCVRHFHLSDVRYDAKDKKCNILTAILFLFQLGIAVFLLLYAKTPDDKPVPYPLENDPTGYSIMVQQFDAFQKGQLALDYPQDLSALTQYQNPYDWSQRADSENFGSPYWDHVYFNGKIYSYFGPAPIFVFYYPYYWMTGTLPADSVTAFFFTVLAITFSFLLIRRFLSCFRIRAGILEVSLAFLTLPAACHLFMIQSNIIFYFIAFSAAYAFLLLFLCLSLAAYEQRATRHGYPLYAAAGLALGLAAASRPTTVIPIFFLILPLYLHVLWDRNMNIKQKEKLVCSFSIPVCAIAALLMWYNFARFGSPFDFGAGHQLTVSDIHYNHVSISASRIASCLRQYWFQPLTLSETFPFIGFTQSGSMLYGNYCYRGFGGLSLMAMPLNLVLFLLPALIRSCRPLYQKAMLISGFLGGACVLYLDFCLGGIQARYTCDASLLFAILSLVTIFFVQETVRKYRMKQFLYAGYLLMGLSILTGWLLMFSNERCLIQNNAPDVFLAFYRFFTI